MSKKLEFRYAGDEHDDDYFRLFYNNVGCGERVHRSRKAAIACSALVSDFTAMQDESKTLRSKGKAFDWLEKNMRIINFNTVLSDNRFVVWRSGSWEKRGSGFSFLSAIENHIAKHETDEIPDKGNTMETKIEMQNVLEIRNVTENEIALFFDGERCSGDHHPSGVFGKIYTRDRLAASERRVEELESELVEAQTLLEEKDNIENKLKFVRIRLLNHEEEYKAMQKGYKALRERLAELEELAEAFKFVKENDLYLKRHPRAEYKKNWDVWNELYGNNIVSKSAGHADDFPAALADYRKKNPEPEENPTELLGIVVDLIPISGQTEPIIGRVRTHLAREKGDSHAD